MYSYHYVGYPLLISVLFSMSNCYNKPPPNCSFLQQMFIFPSCHSLVQAGMEKFYSTVSFRDPGSFSFPTLPVPYGGVFHQIPFIKLWTRENLWRIGEGFGARHGIGIYHCCLRSIGQIQSHGRTNHREGWETHLQCAQGRGKEVWWHIPVIVST